ncbi:hypothetical protein OK016_07705 [Vibrio chagasii]|nr:hypothetical protein [Vibrio chagasii]
MVVARKNRQKQAPRRKPWRSGLLAILLVGGFGYGLYLFRVMITGHLHRLQ